MSRGDGSPARGLFGALGGLGVVAIVFASGACSGEDEAKGNGSGVGSGAVGGAAGSSQLAVGGRAGAAGVAGLGGAAGVAGAGGVAPLGCFGVPTFADCAGVAPPAITITELPPLLRGVVGGFLVAIPNQPGAIALLGGNADDIEEGDGPFASPQTLQTSPLGSAWQTTPLQKAFDQVDGVAVVGDDLWVLSGYPPQIVRCRFDAALVPTCDAPVPFAEHARSTSTFFPLPPGACGYPAGALVLFDIAQEGGEATPEHPAHVYDIAQKQWVSIARPGAPFRRGPKATVLSDGRVLLTGGLREATNDLGAVDTSEIFDGKVFVAGPKLLAARHAHTTKALPNGRVLLMGGYGENQVYPKPEIVDVVAGTSTAVVTDVPEAGQSFAAAGANYGSCAFLTIAGRNPAEKGFVDVFSLGSTGLSRSSVQLPIASTYGHALTLGDGSIVFASGLLPESVGGKRSKSVYRLAP